MPSRTPRHDRKELFWAPLAAALILLAAGSMAEAQVLPGDMNRDPFAADGLGTDTLRGTDSPSGAGDPASATLAPAGTPDPGTTPDTAAGDEDATPAAGRRLTVHPAEDPVVPPPRIGAPRLPSLEAYPTAYPKPRGATVDALDQARTPPPIGPTVAVIPTLPSPKKPKPDLAPFAPLGFTVGMLRLTPYVEQSFGFDSNPDQINTGTKPSAFSRTEGGFDLLSLWSSNELKASVHAGYDTFFSDPGANRPDGNGTVDYRYDVTRDLSFDTEGRFTISTQRPGSPEVGVQLKDRPLVSSYGASVGGTDTFGRLTLALHGTFDRTEDENGTLPDGTTLILDDANFNQYAIVGRATYEISPALKPYVQVTADTRVHDQRVDQQGYARDSDGISGLLGATFELTRLITGDISLGYGDRSYQDRRLGDFSAPLFNASLAYAMTPLTTITLTGSTTFDETTVAGSPGTESHSASLQVSHALLRNVTLTGILTYLDTDYVNSPIVETSLSATLKASYALSRNFVIDASYNHQTLLSNDVDSRFNEDVVMLGLRIQH